MENLTLHKVTKSQYNTPLTENDYRPKQCAILYSLYSLYIIFGNKLTQIQTTHTKTSAFMNTKFKTSTRPPWVLVVMPELQLVFDMSN